jgi:5'-methylthioadenosine phosphorylase
MVEHKPCLGVIGGSGLYAIDGLEQPHRVMVETPFGKPSSALMVGKLAGKTIIFLARHGEGHILSPSEINYRANICALKMQGVERVVAISACGSLREDFAPGDVVVPDQLLDMTRQRANTFFEVGCVVHVSPPDPFCPELSHWAADALEASGATVHRSGAYAIVEGPRFSTRAESHIFRSWGMSIIGMTTSPEAFLAREAELCYAVLAHVTDYDVWRKGEEPVTVEMVARTFQKNTRLVQAALTKLIEILPERRGCDCDKALSDALITNRNAIPDDLKRKLDPIAGRLFS